MAGQVEASGPVTLVEEATHLLRRASLETLLCHWIGSVPFAVALLVFWTQLTHPPLSDAACAAESLGLALLLVWMNCWRSVFTGRLYRDLSGAVDTPWTGKRSWRLIANQAFLGATKLVVLPIALLSVFPLANVVAFYRSVPVLADRQDLDPFGLVAKARRIAARGTAQCWLLQFLLVLFGMVAMLNVALHWSVWALLGLAVAVAAWAIWKSRSARKKSKPAVPAHAPVVERRPAAAVRGEHRDAGEPRYRGYACATRKPSAEAAGFRAAR